MVNNERISPMAVAVLKYHDDVAQLLFNHGADPNISDNQKRTLLMLLANQIPDPVVTERIEYLLDHFRKTLKIILILSIQFNSTPGYGQGLLFSCFHRK